MRVTKAQIVHGIVDYIQSDILPQMGGARSMQILVSIGANAIAANNKLVEEVFKNQIVMAMLDDDGTGTYDLSGLVDAMTKSIRQFGSFPVQVPAIPLISPTGFTLSLTAEDIDAMKRKIEGEV
ncbi:MAG: hypothetical protein J6S60_04750 [Oscillospiraceae bacterium]|nr:hypothetical protein [Oscillospiraceae bacterium]